MDVYGCEGDLLSVGINISTGSKLLLTYSIGIGRGRGGAGRGGQPPNNSITLGGGGGGNIPFAPPPNNPSILFSSNVYVTQLKLDRKCTKLMYVPFILFEGISKSILINSILNFAILSVSFQREMCSYLELIGGRRSSDQFTAGEKFAPPPFAPPPAVF